MGEFYSLTISRIIMRKITDALFKRFPNFHRILGQFISDRPERTFHALPISFMTVCFFSFSAVSSLPLGSSP